MARGTGPYLFQVGFNKCGTTSLYELFQRSGVPAMHGFLPKEHMAPMKQSRRAVIQRHVRKSVANPENPLGKLSRTGVRAFFDMELVSATECIENFRHFPVFARAYPDAIFLLNTRERDDWLRSRARHLDGTYLAAATTRLAKSEDEVLAIWADDFDGHHEAVRTFFRDTPERLVEFHITRDGIDGLIDRLRPAFALDAAHWDNHLKTDKLASRHGWRDQNANRLAKGSGEPAEGAG